MRIVSIVVLLTAASAIATAQTPPKVLLVQTLAPVENGADFNVNVRSFFALEFDEDGRLEPITWSMTDPVFRKAVEDKVIADPVPSPNLNQASEVAAKLGCEYVCVISALRHGSNVMADMRLYKSKRELWKGGQLLQASVQDAMQVESTARSLARTWIFQMAQGPLKGLKATPKVRTPDPDPGTKPPTPPVNDPVKQADDFAIRAEFDRLMKLGESRAAMQLLRDSVDVEPLNFPRRKLLIQVLLERGDSVGAAKEARRSAGLFPEEVSLWRMCARTAIESGDYAQAIRDLNESIAREPENAETRMLLGEAQLLAGRLNFALEHLNASIKLQPGAEALAFRAATYFAAGDMAQGKQDLDTIAKDFPIASQPNVDSIRVMALRYQMAQVTDLGADVRQIIQQIRLKPADKSHAENLKMADLRTEGVRQFAEAIGANKRFQKSFDALELALNLLSQAMSEARSFLASKNEESLGDATITLGEAFKALETAQKEMIATP